MEIKTQNYVAGPGKLLFPKLIEPDEYMGNKSWSTSIILDKKEGVALMKKLEDMMSQVSSQAKSSKSNALPLKLNDSGEYILKAKARYQNRNGSLNEIVVVDPVKQPYNKDVMGGELAKLAVGIYPYDTQIAHGITVILNAVQILEEKTLDYFDVEDAYVTDDASEGSVSEPNIETDF